MEKLKKTKLLKKERFYLHLLEKNLSDIASSGSYRLSAQLLPLTPMEIQVANFVKQGKSTKQIAEILNLSEKTIETHRKHIRTQIGIKAKKTNLRSFLMTFQ